MNVMFFLRGLPGAGKTSLANYIWDPGVVFEADKYIPDVDGKYVWTLERSAVAHKKCQLAIERAMEMNKQSGGKYYPEIILTNTSTTDKEMKPYEELADKYGYLKIYLVVENRHGGQSIHGVPSEVLGDMKDRFQIKL